MSVRLKLPGNREYFVQEAMNVLRTNVLFSGQDVKAIVMTSHGQNEGKTVMTLHLGRSLAELGKRVLVIDADMRKSVMAARNTDASGKKGLSEVLTGQANLEDCISQTETEGLDILFSGKYPPNPTELLNGPYFEQLLEFTKQCYDYLLVDTPPLGMVIDAAVIAAKCDSAIMVIGSRKVRSAQAKEVVDQLEKSGCRVLGVVLNNVEPKGGRYYRRKYYRGGYYRNAYGKYSSSGKYPGRE